MLRRRSFLKVAFAARLYRLKPRLGARVDRHSPRSTESRSSFSSASSFMIVRFLLQIPLRGLPTRNDRLQDNQPVVFDERHEVDIVVTLDDEDPLAAVSLLVRVFQDVEHSAPINTFVRYP